MDMVKFWTGAAVGGILGFCVILAADRELKVMQKDIEHAEQLCNSPALQLSKRKETISRKVILTVYCDKLGELEVILERPGKIE